MEAKDVLMILIGGVGVMIALLSLIVNIVNSINGPKNK